MSGTNFTRFRSLPRTTENLSCSSLAESELPIRDSPDPNHTPWSIDSSLDRTELQPLTVPNGADFQSADLERADLQASADSGRADFQSSEDPDRADLQSFEETDRTDLRSITDSDRGDLFAAGSQADREPCRRSHKHKLTRARAAALSLPLRGFVVGI